MEVIDHLHTLTTLPPGQECPLYVGRRVSRL